MGESTKGNSGKFLVVAIVLAAAVGVVMLKQKKTTTSPNGATAAPAQPTDSGESATVSKLPRLVDLGASTCVPCKMMVPVLAELEKEYAGRLEVVFIDVRENGKAKEEYGIRMIPTQVFFDAEGVELFRHEGFYAKEDILKKWKELGVKLDAKKEPAPTEKIILPDAGCGT
jgi:thioredoxin 1